VCPNDAGENTCIVKWPKNNFAAFDANFAAYHQNEGEFCSVNSLVHLAMGSDLFVLMSSDGQRA
jgi:hypothetical protein